MRGVAVVRGLACGRRAARVGAFSVATVALLTVNAPVSGQEDFRAADLDRPTRVEDAFPIKYREWEFEFGSRGELAEGGRGVHTIFEVKTGLFRNAQFGLEVEGGASSGDVGAGTDRGIESAGAHLLVGVARESLSTPAVALRLDAKTPGSGSLGKAGWQAGAKGILTRSVGRARVHANGGYQVASVADGGDFWRVGVGGDYPLGLFSRSVLADVYAEVPTSGGQSRVWVDVGTRLQVSNWSVLDLGVATRLDLWSDGVANVELVVGLSRVFGIAGLVQVDPYPDPPIR